MIKNPYCLIPVSLPDVYIWTIIVYLDPIVEISMVFIMLQRLGTKNKCRDHCTSPLSFVHYSSSFLFSVPRTFVHYSSSFMFSVPRTFIHYSSSFLFSVPPTFVNFSSIFLFSVPPTFVHYSSIFLFSVPRTFVHYSSSFLFSVPPTNRRIQQNLEKKTGLSITLYLSKRYMFK